MNSMLPMISVIVPVYNTQNYLEKCVNSILQQDYSALEILLIDDGSTDQSGSLCDQFSTIDSRIKVFHKKNGGSSSARNLGLSHATGDFISFIDSDDWLEPNMFTSLLGVYNAHPDAKIVQCMSRDFSETGELLKDYVTTGYSTYFIHTYEFLRSLLLYTGDSSFCTKLIKREFMVQYHFSESKLNEDFELLLQMIPSLTGIWVVEIPGYNILIRQGSNQRSGFHKYLYESVIDNAYTAYSMIKDSYPVYQQEADRFLFGQECIYLLHIPVSQMNSQNPYYIKILKHIRKNRISFLTNPCITRKEKRNLFILSLFPKASKYLHTLYMYTRRS